MGLAPCPVSPLAITRSTPCSPRREASAAKEIELHFPKCCKQLKRHRVRMLLSDRPKFKRGAALPGCFLSNASTDAACYAGKNAGAPAPEGIWPITKASFKSTFHLRPRGNSRSTSNTFCV